jgi:hypothetical protein
VNLPTHLALEELPTGTFGDAPATRPHRQRTQPRPVTEAEAAQHCADLIAALDDRDAAHRTRRRAA